MPQGSGDQRGSCHAGKLSRPAARGPRSRAPGASGQRPKWQPKGRCTGGELANALSSSSGGQMGLDADRHLWYSVIGPHSADVHSPVAVRAPSKRFSPALWKMPPGDGVTRRKRALACNGAINESSVYGPSALMACAYFLCSACGLTPAQAAMATQVCPASRRRRTW